jgi:glycosyltransferase involved in cell wall biosynthesis
VGAPRRAHRRFRVLVDASNYKPDMTGVRTYTQGLVATLARRPGFELFVATSVPDDFANLENCSVLAIHPRTRAPKARFVWRESRLSRLAKDVRADVLIAPGHEGPLRRISAPTVLVVHDVGPLVAPALFGRQRWIEYWVAWPRMCRNATAIVCVSHATFRALHAALGVDREKCVVIGEGPQTATVERTRTSAAGDPYIFYAGSMFSHKNVASLARTFIEHDLSPLRLRLAGPIRRHQLATVEEWCACAPGDAVVHEGYLSSEELPQRYRNALCVALPSLYEGYGLTALEALCGGVPLVATDLPSVRELCGDSAIYIADPFDTQQWARAFRLLQDDAATRERMRRRAAEIARQTTWEDVGEAFDDLIARLVHPSAPTDFRTRNGASRPCL